MITKKFKNDEPNKVFKKTDENSKRTSVENFVTILEDEINTILKVFENYKNDDYK